MRVGLVADEFEIFVFEIEDVGDSFVYTHFRQGIGLPGQLFLGLFDVVGIEMHIAESVDEFAGFETSDLRNHHGEQRV